MIPKISRIVLILFGVLGLSMALPRLYRLCFEQNIRRYMIGLTYSEALQGFIERRLVFDPKAQDYVDRVTDQKGKVYTPEERDALFPLSQLTERHRESEDGPESLVIQGVTVTSEEAQQAAIEDSVDAGVSRRIDHGLRLIRSVRGESDEPADDEEASEADPNASEAKQVLPEVFRIGPDGLQCLHVVTNTLNIPKSQKLNTLLGQQGFVAPARHLWHTVRNQRASLQPAGDQGHLILDAKKQLFLFGQKTGDEFFCRKIAIPEGVQIRTFSTTPPIKTVFPYYGIVISEDSKLYLVSMPDFAFSRLPIEDFNPDLHHIRLNGNYFYRFICLDNSSREKLYVFDRTFQKLIASHEITYPAYPDSRAGKAEELLFPLRTELNNEGVYTLDFKTSPFAKVVWLNLLFVALLVPFKVMTHTRLTSWTSLVDYAITLVTGIFGFISVLVFPNRH